MGLSNGFKGSCQKCGEEGIVYPIVEPEDKILCKSCLEELEEPKVPKETEGYA